MGVTAQIVEAQVDWITASVTYDKLARPQDRLAGWTLANDLLAAERARGNDMRPARLHQYDGFQCGQAYAGISEQGYLTRLSGRLAAENWQPVYEQSTGVSRLDVAMTVRLTGSWVDLSRIHHQEALDYQRDHNPRLRVTRIDGGKHGNSLMVGSRSSEGYGRCYDKELESGSEAYQDCWRYEVEFKKDRAVIAACQLSAMGYQPAVCASIVSTWFQRRGIRPAAAGALLIDTSVGRARADDQRRLAWLGASCKPTVLRLISSLGSAQVLDALGLSELLSANDRHPAPAQSTQEGS